MVRQKEAVLPVRAIRHHLLTNSSSKKKTYQDTYDDVYFDKDCDVDRHNSDSHYANGVDDAMDEMGEDW